MRQVLEEIALSQRQNRDTKCHKQARNKKAIKQMNRTTSDELSRAGASRARPGQAPRGSAWFDCFPFECPDSFNDHSRPHFVCFKTVSSTDSTHYRPMKARL